MTIAAGFKIQEGVVLCADTKHTYSGAMKLQSAKIFKKDDYPSGIKTAFCIVGSVRYCKMIIQKCEGALARLGAHECSRAEVRAVIETILITAFEEHIYRHPDFTRGSLAVGYLIAIWSPIDGIGFYSTEDTAINELVGYECLGAGSYLGHYLLRPLFRPNLKIKETILLATHALIQTKNYDDNCGGDSQFIWMRPDGTVSDVESFDISQNESYSKSFERLRQYIFYDLPDLDLEDDELYKKLAKHSEFLAAIRSDLRSERDHHQMLLDALSGKLAKIAKEIKDAKKGT